MRGYVVLAAISTFLTLSSCNVTQDKLDTTLSPQAANAEAFEPDSSTNGWATYTVTWRATKGPKCDWTDTTYKVNNYGEGWMRDWKLTSFTNPTYQRNPTSTRTPPRYIFGYDLNTTNGYICVGTQEFVNGWKVGDVPRYLVVYAK